MKQEPKRCVVVGAGPRATALAEAMQGHPEVVLAGVCDPSSSAVERFTARFTVVAAAGLDGVLAEARPDFAVVATPPERHVEDAVALIRAGVPTLVECPMVETFAQARTLHQEARRGGVPVEMAESFCYLPGAQAMKQIAAKHLASGEGILGGEGLYIEMDFSITPGNWREHYEMTRYITHGLGPLLYATGHRARRVVGLDPLGRHSRSSGALLPTVLVETDHGAVFYLAHSGLAPRPVTRWCLVGESWSLETDPSGSFDGPVRVFEPRGEDPASGQWNTHPLSPSQLYADQWGKGWEAERLMLSRFARQVDGAPAELGIDLSLNISLAGVAAAQSAKKGGEPVAVPETDHGGVIA
ncbi:Gfo/Idh/MocA family protein [Streptomyces sp. NPDC048751]|uniref:Gfo/Idh/MocA family protein n=1 Tax=Streptomyces sp. NPDC048751 TaxID=3365591 RepID=UPI003721042A